MNFQASSYIQLRAVKRSLYSISKISKEEVKQTMLELIKSFL